MTYPMHTQDIICYELRSFFHDSPSLLNCPICGCVLEAQDTPPSAEGQKFSQRASIPVVETSLYTCPGCGWWALREMRSDCEINDGIGDYLILPERWPLSAGAAKRQPSNGSKALESLGAGREAIPISAPAAQHLFGDVQVLMKKRPIRMEKPRRRN